MIVTHMYWGISMIVALPGASDESYTPFAYDCDTLGPFHDSEILGVSMTVTWGISMIVTLPGASLGL